MKFGFTCLIPAYNEGPRIGAVLRAVMSTAELSAVIVIDDGSSDDTFLVAKAAGARVIRQAQNQGKTAALARGLTEVTTSHVVLIDADLEGLRPLDISALIRPVASQRAEVSLSLRSNAPWLWRVIGVDYITGERVVPTWLLQDAAQDLATLPRFGFEVYLNDCIGAARLATEVVRWDSVASPLKSRKRGFWRGMQADFAMMADIFGTVSPFGAIRQIRYFRSAASELAKAARR
jgi:glycosyltransferase involved in cell wall biosynthesis